MVAFHGLEKMRGGIQHLLERKEVVQSAPDLQVVVGRSKGNRGRARRLGWGH
jgi:hypothetical protein